MAERSSRDVRKERKSPPGDCKKSGKGEMLGSFLSNEKGIHKIGYLDGGKTILKTRGKRIALIVIAIFLLIFDSMWLLACLFAVGQLYDTYDLWLYLGEAPVAAVILVGLFVAAVICVVRAITLKDKGEKDKGNEDRIDKDQE